MNYDRTTPGKLLGHKKDDWKRAWAAVNRVRGGIIAECKIVSGANHNREAIALARKLRKEGFEVEVLNRALSDESTVRWWTRHDKPARSA